MPLHILKGSKITEGLLSLTHTLNMEGKGCMIIIYNCSSNSSYTNAISSSCVTYLGLKFIPHPRLNSFSWVSNTSITIKRDVFYLSSF
jgi:hypothetical protein